jgi:hypothetical protein
VLGKFTGEDQANGRLDFTGRDRGLLVIGSELRGLGSDTLKNVCPKRINTKSEVKTEDCIPLTKEFKIDMARLEIPVSG